MGWKRLDFDAKALTRRVPETVAEAFAAAYRAAGAPTNAAVFEHREGDGLHLFFSPGAAALFADRLSVLRPRRAGAPPAGARLLVGSAETWLGPGNPPARPQIIR